MQNNQSQLPVEIQLQVVCTPRMLETYDLLTPFLPELKEWNPKHGSHELYKEIVKGHHNLTPIELIKHLDIHPEICEILLIDSYNKRFTPSTFIEQKQDQYRVGWVPGGQNPINQIRAFSSFVEATADYVLFSWGFPRLTAEQANWVEVEHY